MSADRAKPIDPNQDKSPNYRHKGMLHLVKCYRCDPTYGRENWGPAVALGQCAWCGWIEEPKKGKI